jgi:hypothetical protein
MRTTKSRERGPRILVKILQADRIALGEKVITTEEGKKVKLFLRSLMEKEKDETPDAVRVGRIMGFSEGVTGLKKGDIAILDYKVDTDNDQYLVMMDGLDKIVSIPCVTTFCTDEKVATSYDEKYIERNVIVHKPGDVYQESLLFGVIRGTKFIPNDHYLFCEPELPKVAPLLLFMEMPEPETYVQRKIIFASKRSGFKTGQTVVAIKNSNMTLNIADNMFDIIPVSDILAIIEIDKEAA